MYKTSLFIFRRDLRLEDNIGLIQALSTSEEVIPCFIFTPEQTKNNPYKGKLCFQFMLDALEDLDHALQAKGSKLHYFFGKPHEVVATCLLKLSIDAVFANRDYTPYSLHRDELISKTCQKNNIPFLLYDDSLLHPPEDTLKKDGKPYLIFTPFYKYASTLPVANPLPNRRRNYFSGNIPFTLKANMQGTRRQLRKKCLDILSNPPMEATGLSPYLKFTICSPREAHSSFLEKFGKGCPLIRQLYWRDFFTSIAFFFPHVFKGAFHSKYDKIQWNTDKKVFLRWCQGSTGFPFIDAAMRQLNQTGEMPNRMRMAVASFLTKDLHINWKWGEKYFAQHLLDYDPAVNNGNWQWVASTGADSQPYFRVFNPWLQQKKFDPECLYIKKWVPELSSLSPRTIHRWGEETCSEINYPSPMLDHQIAAKNHIKYYFNL